MKFESKDADEVLDEATMSVQPEIEGLPEAPASATVKVWIKGYGVMLTVRDTKANDMIKKTEMIIDYAQSHGWKNVWDTPTSIQTPSQPTNPQAPICGVHRVAMTWKTGVSKKTNKPYAFWSCSTKNADGSFCTFKPEGK